MLHNKNTLYRIKSGYTLRHFCDEFLVMPVGLNNETETKMGILNSVGEVLWKTLEKECTFYDLLKAVTDEFDVSEEEASKDIEDFLQQLDNHGFLIERR